MSDSFLHMKLWTWIKGLSWVAILGAVGAAAVMVLNAKRAGKLEANVAHQEDEIKELNKGSIEDVQAAKKLQEGIAVKKEKAREVRKKSEASLERIGQDETMADIAERFNGKRVRRREDPAPEV